MGGCQGLVWSCSSEGGMRMGWTNVLNLDLGILAGDMADKVTRSNSFPNKSQEHLLCVCRLGSKYRHITKY